MPPTPVHTHSHTQTRAQSGPASEAPAPRLLTAWWLDGGRLFSTLGGTSYTSSDGSQPLGPLTAMGGVSYTWGRKGAVIQVPGPPDGVERAETPEPTTLARAGKATPPSAGPAKSPPPRQAGTYLLAVLAGKPSNRGHVVDVLGPRAQQVARDVILVLLWLGGLEHIALPHAGGYHHLGADGRLSPPALEASLQGLLSGPQGDSTPCELAETHKGEGQGSPKSGLRGHSETRAFSSPCILCPFFNDVLRLETRKRKWLLHLDDQVSEEGAYGLGEDGPSLSGVPLPQDTSQLHAHRKVCPRRAVLTAGSSTNGSVVPGWAQRRWPARDPNSQSLGPPRRWWPGRAASSPQPSTPPTAHLGERLLRTGPVGTPSSQADGVRVAKTPTPHPQGPETTTHPNR